MAKRQSREDLTGLADFQYAFLFWDGKEEPQLPTWSKYFFYRLVEGEVPQHITHKTPGDVLWREHKHGVIGSWDANTRPFAWYAHEAKLPWRKALSMASASAAVQGAWLHTRGGYR